MASVSTIAAIRFGYGLGPGRPVQSPATLLGGLPDGNAIAAGFPVTPSSEVYKLAIKMRAARKAARNSDQRTTREMAAREELRIVAWQGALQSVARILDTQTAFFERLNWFWADHFTAVGKNLPARAVGPAYMDEAIRPHITGRFADMLKAVITHPFMLVYLDQVASVGPNSVAGKRRKTGLNENLARELLELHTLGVDGDYGQQDVRQLAELLTGLSFTAKKGFVFNPRMSEPGVKTVVGRQYGGASPDLHDIYAALEDLAAHPDTARHLARKLAVHFVADVPDEALVEAMTAAYLGSDGDLMAVYAALLEHPSAWSPLGQKAKQPFDFIASALVALDVSGAELLALKQNDLRNLLARPLVAMGQPFMEPRGPDGWPEAAENWITPQGLATRISWSVGVSKYVGDRVGDPGEFLQRTLADAAGERLIRAVEQSVTVEDAIALVFASAEFNRR